MEQLSQQEVLFVKRLYKIRHSLGELNKWFYETAMRVKNDEIPDINDEGSLRKEWAKKRFEKLCLETAEKEMFSIELIADPNIKKRVKEILKK